MCWHFDKTRVAHSKLLRSIRNDARRWLISAYRTLSVKRKTARLACVRHAASVRPEPGSNSQINI